MALARTSTPCGVEVRAALLVLFPIFMGKHLAFHRWVWCWLWTFHRCLVSGWGNSLLFCLLSAFITNQDYTDVGEERMTADIGEGSASKWSQGIVVAGLQGGVSTWEWRASGWLILGDSNLKRECLLPSGTWCSIGSPQDGLDTSSILIHQTPEWFWWRSQGFPRGQRGV